MSDERWRHLVERRGADAHFCLGHMHAVLRDPFWIGRRAHGALAEVDFARFVGDHRQLLLVAVKFIETRREAWVSTVYPWSATWLTRRLRSGTMIEVDSGS